MIFDLCYHPYYPCLYAFWYSIPTFFSIFCNCFLYLYADSRYTLNHKVQATLSTVGAYDYNNGIISAFLKMDAGGGPETVLPLGVALFKHSVPKVQLKG